MRSLSRIDTPSCTQIDSRGRRGGFQEQSRIDASAFLSGFLSHVGEREKGGGYRLATEF